MLAGHSLLSVNHHYFQGDCEKGNKSIDQIYAGNRRLLSVFNQ